MKRGDQKGRATINVNNVYKLIMFNMKKIPVFFCATQVKGDLKEVWFNSYRLLNCTETPNHLKYLHVLTIRDRI